MSTHSCEDLPMCQWTRLRVGVVTKTIMKLDEQSVLVSIYQLGVQLKLKYEYSKALTWCLFCYEQYVKTKGMNYPLTLFTANTIAELYDEQGKYEDALTWFKRVLEGFVTLHGELHRTTIAIMNHIALTLSNMGHFSEAMKWQNRALSTSIQANGSHDRNTYDTLNNLGCIYTRSGQTSEAFVQFNKVLSWREINLGKDHVDTHAVWNNLAITLSRQNRLDNSLSWFRRVLSARMESLGPQHPDTLITMNNMALTLSARGSHDEASKLLSDSQTGFTVIYDTTSPVLCSVMYNHALVLCRREQYSQALQLIHSILSVYFSEQRDLSSILKTTNTIALTLCEKKQLRHAAHWLRCVVEWQMLGYGSKHHMTVSARTNLAEILHKQGKYEEAYILWTLVLQDYEHELGVHHPSSLAVLENIAAVLVNQGRWDEALETYQRLYAGNLNNFGTANEITFDTMYRIGCLYTYTNDNTRAISSLKTAYDGYKNILGERHYKTEAAYEKLSR